jgi:hypothetical protein
MNSRYLVLAVGAIAAILAIYFLYPRADANEIINPDSSWRPTASEIEASVGRGPITGISDPRMTKFCEQFKQRYRDHQRAVGMKFVSVDKIKAMFEPGISRWEMAQISAQADLESSRIFGRHFEIGIYETYITAMRKIGVMKAEPLSGRLIARFGPQFAEDGPSRASIERYMAHRAVEYFSELVPISRPTVRMRGFAMGVSRSE